LTNNTVVITGQCVIAGHINFTQVKWRFVTWSAESWFSEQIVPYLPSQVKLSWTTVGVRATKDLQLAYIVDTNIDMAVFIFKVMMFMI